MRWLLLCVVLLAGQARAQCCGDCDGSQTVTIDELVACAGSALAGRAGCGDCDGDGRIGIDELVRAVRGALDECGRMPLPTRTPTATPTASPTPTPGQAERQLRLLVGAWAMTYTTVSTRTDRFFLNDLDLSDPEQPALFGVSLDTGLDVLALASTTGGRTYYMLAPGFFACDYFEFDLTRDDRLRGEHFTTRREGTVCTDFVGTIDAMVGERMSRLAGAGALTQQGAGGASVAPGAAERLLRELAGRMNR